MLVFVVSCCCLLDDVGVCCCLLLLSHGGNSSSFVVRWFGLFVCCGVLVFWACGVLCGCFCLFVSVRNCVDVCRHSLCVVVVWFSSLCSLCALLSLRVAVVAVVRCWLCCWK